MAYDFCDPKVVDARITQWQANPEMRPASGTYCRGCQLAGMFHCGDPKHCGGQVPFDDIGPDAKCEG